MPPEITLESLARRVEALEALLRQGGPPPASDWLSVAGMFAGREFKLRVDDEARAIREAERLAEVGDIGGPE